MDLRDSLSLQASSYKHLHWECGHSCCHHCCLGSHGRAVVEGIVVEVGAGAAHRRQLFLVVVVGGVVGARVVHSTRLKSWWWGGQVPQRGNM